jgi:hypothetical protein
MMNKDLEGGVYVALKGRVPIMVIGPIIKGQDLVPTDNGYAICNDDSPTRAFAVALESNNSTDVKLIEALVL